MIIVENHHEVLEHWARYRATLSRAPRLITLDHHTDTSAPFRTHLKSFAQEQSAALQKKLLESIDFNSLITVKDAQSKLDHDEHIVTAIKTDIISSALVIAQNARDTDRETYERHKIICLGVDRKLNSKGLSVEDYNHVLETHFLSAMLDKFSLSLKNWNEPDFWDHPFIFDIDLDYLNTKKSVSPDDSLMFGELVKRAGLITIAVETQHVLFCAREPGINSDYLLIELQKVIDGYR